MQCTLLLIVLFTACCKADDKNCEDSSGYFRSNLSYWCTGLYGDSQGAPMRSRATGKTEPFSVLCPRLCGLCDTDYVRAADCSKHDPIDCTWGFMMG